MGGNSIVYSGDFSTLLKDITKDNIIINRNNYTPGERYMCCDIKDFYLVTPLIIYEYKKIPIDILTEDIIMEYNLMNLDHNGYIYCEIWKGMYGLLQAGILVNQKLVQLLEPKGYTQCKHTPGQWSNKWRPIKFSLLVDDCGVKYVGKQHADHLINIIQEHYQLSTDWEGKRYCGISIKCNYQKQVVDLSIPGYI